MKANPGECHLLLNTNEPYTANISNYVNKNKNSVKLLGATIDSLLKFDEHVNNICKKAHQKLSALSRILNFMSLDKRKILFSAFSSSQFQYCPLAWMDHSSNSNNKINRLHE